MQRPLLTYTSQETAFDQNRIGKAVACMSLDLGPANAGMPQHAEPSSSSDRGPE